MLIFRFSSLREHFQARVNYFVSSREPVRLGSYVWLIVAICFSPALKPAHAYLDPGTGSYIIQVVIGVVAGTTYALRTFFARLIAKFRKPKRKSEETTPKNDE